MDNYEREILEKVINHEKGLSGFLRDYRKLWDWEINTEKRNNDLLRESMWMVDYALTLELIHHLGNNDWKKVEETFGRASAIGTDLLVTICPALGIEY